MQSTCCVCALTVIASNLSAQLFVEQPRSMYGQAFAGRNECVIDVDGDGFLDVLARGSASGTDVHWFRNDGGGAFTLASSFPGLSGNVLRQAVGDYNGDGRQDYTLGGRLLRNQGDGTFAVDPAATVLTIGGLEAFLDYDRDGDLDWLAHGFGGRQLFANQGGGVFVDVTAAVLSGFNRSNQVFRVVDLDADGDLDVVNLGGSFGPLVIDVWRNSGQGQFTQEVLPVPPALALAGAFSTLQVADFDGDGRPEILVSAPVSGPTGTVATWSLITGGTGAWALTPINFPVAPTPATVTAGDWNGDGRADLVDRTGVYLQTTPLQFVFQAFPPGVNLADMPLLIDLDGDQRLDALAHGGLGYLRNRATGVEFSERSFFSPAAAPMPTQVRRRFGSADIEALSSGLAWGTDALLPGDAERTLRFVFAPGSASAALVAPPSVVGPPGVIACGPVRFYEVINGILTTSAAPPQPSVAPSHVAAADLDGQTGDEIVFGAAGSTGPMIFARTLTGFVDVTPTLAPVAVSPAATFEQVLLVDVDGDGDRDILHEYRWLRNDAGSWVDAAQFGALMPATSRVLVALDVDRDGDQDLFVAGEVAGSSRVLVNVAGTFVDATTTWLGNATLSFISIASAGDIDDNGTVDLLVGPPSQALMNSGFSFTVVPNVGPSGILADLNQDDRPDLFGSGTVWWNRHTLLRARGPAATRWTVDLQTRRSGPPVVLAALMLGTAETLLSVPGIGTLFLDPTTLVAVNLPLASGAGSLGMAIPPTPAVIGIRLVAQAVTWDTLRFHFSNPVRDRVR